jgi:hypothetical protein
MSPNPEMEASVNVNSEVEIVVGWMKKSWDHFKMLEDGESTFNLFLKM